MFLISLEDQVALNQFAQSLRTADDLLNRFSDLTLESKRSFLLQFSGMIQQSSRLTTMSSLLLKKAD
ncbi:hypothetical protein SAMN05216327_12055 [Dyadobacter sp. SG02]|nr:hypothetical protein SAMN05216327_12055 [Dyadobacter sp. SG02]